MSDKFGYLGFLCIILSIILQLYLADFAYRGNIVMSIATLALGFINTSNVLVEHNIKEFNRRDIPKFYVALIAYLFSISSIIRIFI